MLLISTVSDMVGGGGGGIVGGWGGWGDFRGGGFKEWYLKFIVRFLGARDNFFIYFLLLCDIRHHVAHNYLTHTQWQKYEEIISQ